MSQASMPLTVERVLDEALGRLADWGRPAHCAAGPLQPWAQLARSVQRRLDAGADRRAVLLAVIEQARALAARESAARSRLGGEVQAIAAQRLHELQNYVAVVRLLERVPGPAAS